jgi:hypothetical protein
MHIQASDKELHDNLVIFIINLILLTLGSTDPIVFINLLFNYGFLTLSR